MKVGIDFGTTNSTIGNLRNDGSRSVHPPIPSIIAWKNGDLTFGNNAQILLRSDDSNVYAIRDLKMILGRDEYISFGQTRVSTLELVTEYLKYLIDIQLPDGDIDTAIIATPVKASVKHRSDLRIAAKKAGIDNVTFVYEPTAALIGVQRFETLSANELVLVVDWGGGTLDIAVIKTDGNNYEELSVGGDIQDLGGSQIDSAIMDRILNADDKLRAVIDKIDGGRERLKNEIEEIKISMLTSLEGENAEIEMEYLDWAGEDCILYVNPIVVFEVVHEYAQAASQVILRKLRKSSIEPKEINRILFAGGVCKSPSVREKIMSNFGDSLQITNVAGTNAPIRPQELTGAGCTEITNAKMVVELGINIGVRQADESICILLDKGVCIELNTYRTAVFIVTDPKDDEAILDIGVINSEKGKKNLLGWHVENFESLEQIFIPAGRYYSTQTEPILDRVTLRCGIDDNLTVKVCAHTQLIDETKESFVSGIPFTLRFDR